jgi:prepilin-type processing-associated H-X9-DG protein
MVPPYGDYGQIRTRHHDGANVLFFDGHVKWLRREAFVQNPGDMWGFWR